MDLVAHIDKTERRQYFTQANIVYLSSFFAYFVLIPLLFFAGDLMVALAAFAPMIISGVAYLINRKGRYGLASLIFILIMTMQATLSTFRYGLAPGFAFYYLNLCVLIVFTNWKGPLKLIGIFIEVALFVLVFLYLHYFGAQNTMSDPYLITFVIINMALNVIGVANSSHFYLMIATRAQKDLRIFATTDYLTSLPNRAAFYSFVSKIKPNKQGNSPEFAILMLDVDYFKFINDKYGHPIGDKVLVRVSELLHSLVGEQDFLGRHGGEEFVILHFEKDVKEIAKFAEKIRKTIEQTMVEVDNFHIKFTVSIGVLARLRDEITYEKAISLADLLLYEAKDNGRNCVKMKVI